MAWQSITDTDWEYDDDAYNNLPASRKSFWDDQTGISIANGIRTKSNGVEIYMRVRKTGDTTVPYYENELNKTYLENK